MVGLDPVAQSNYCLQDIFTVIVYGTNQFGHTCDNWFINSKFELYLYESSKIQEAFLKTPFPKLKARDK
jgi:hypothetical protein